MVRFDGLALINAVTELAELLGRRTTVDSFLGDLVNTVADHLASDVCSVYLYDVEQDLLVLRATRGLNPDLIGRVRLGPGEGLTGHAFLENRPVLERDAGHSRFNKAIPDLGEEEYPAFLGVPIKRNDLGIGVLVLQYRNADSVDNQVLRALRALASHLAATLENAAALYELHEEERPAPADGTVPEKEQFTSGLLQGSSASRGIAVGLLEYLDERATSSSTPVRRSIREAIDWSAHQLQELQRSINQTLSDVAMMIFSSHLLMLRDESFVGRMVELADDGLDPREAVQTVVDDFSQRFAAIPDPRFQEKVQDVQDLGHRIVRNLHALEEMESDYRGHIVVSGEIFPSELVKLHLQNVEGLVFSGGSATSHVAILAQSLGLPVVAIPDRRLFSIPPGTRLVVDAEDGKLVVDPAPGILEAYRRRIRAAPHDSLEHDDAGAPQAISTPVYTSDGTRVHVLANVNLVKDAIGAAAIGAEGVGLYRSEFPFLIRNGFPVEDEQVTVYRRVVTAMKGRPVSFRTLDLGGDKLLSSQVGREDNPFLGFRGIRFLLEHRDLLRDQIRAMLRAGYDADIGIQFPMVASLEEFLAARDEVHRSIASLREEGVEHNDRPRLGVMVELPATLEIAADLAEVVDFFSIGSNDLTMYMLAADRTNHRVAGLYRSIHPGVLRSLARFVTETAPFGKPVSVCGAHAADTAMVLFYLGAGITRLSVDPFEIPRLARALRQIDMSDARRVAAGMLATRTASEMNTIVEGIRNRFD